MRTGGLPDRSADAGGLLASLFVGVLGSFVGEFLFGLLGIHASGSFSSFAISVVGACICIWIGQKISK